MEKLGVGYVLGPYQTCPWSFYQAEKGVTFSAEVRMGPDSDEVEAEAQLMYDNPASGMPSMEQVCYLRVTPSTGRWEVADQRVQGKPYGREITNWKEKSCDFFGLLVQKLKAEELPNIEELLDEAFRKERGADQRGGGGKAPKIRPGQLLNMKKGGGGF